MIRSRAMLDFRRRERSNNIRAFRNHAADNGTDTGKAKRRGHQEERPKQRSHNATAETNQHFLHSSSNAQGGSFPGLNYTVRLRDPHVPGFYDPSAISGSDLLNLGSSVEYDKHVFGPALPDTVLPAAAPVTSNPLVPYGTDLLQQRPPSYNAVFAGRSQFSVKHHTRGTGAVRSTGDHYVCQFCLSQAARCSVCVALGSVNEPSTQELAMTVPDYHYIKFPDSIGKPTYSISSLSSRDPHEQMALQYFHCVVAKDVSGSTPLMFWEHLVPQMCEMEDTARQVAIALSQVHRERVSVILSSQHNSSQSNFGSLSSAELELKASRALRKYIETCSSPSYELVLTCSVMLYTIESIFGREKSAILHLENGLKMFKAWQTARKQVKPRGSEMAFHSLTIALARLDMSLTIANDKRIPVFEHDERFPETMSLETLMASLNFTSPHDAHYHLIRILTPTSVFVIKYRQWHGKYARDIPHQIVEEQRMRLKQFRAWDMAMNCYESDSRDENKPNDRRAEAISLLATRMVHWSAEKVLEEFVRADDDVSPWDRAPPKLLTYTSELLDHRDRARLAEGHLGHTSFSPQVAECGFLLMLAHRTALPHIRAEALRIAQRFARKEGVRDLCGAFIKWTHLPVPRPPFPFLLGTPGH